MSSKVNFNALGKRLPQIEPASSGAAGGATTGGGAVRPRRQRPKLTRDKLLLLLLGGRPPPEPPGRVVEGVLVERGRAGVAHRTSMSWDELGV